MCWTEYLYALQFCVETLTASWWLKERKLWKVTGQLDTRVELLYEGQVSIRRGTVAHSALCHIRAQEKMVFLELSPLTHDMVDPPFSAVNRRSVASHPVPGNFLQQLKPATARALCDTAALPTTAVCSMTLCVCVILRVGPHPYHFPLHSTVWIVRSLLTVFVPAADWLRNSSNEKQISLCPNRYGHWLLIPLPPGSSDFLLGLSTDIFLGLLSFQCPESHC